MLSLRNTLSSLLLLLALLLLCPLPIICDKVPDLEPPSDSFPITSNDCTSYCYQVGTIASACIDDGEPDRGMVLPCYCRDKPFLMVFSSCILKSGHCKTPDEESHSLRHLHGLCSINGVGLPGAIAEDLPLALGIDRNSEWVPPVIPTLRSTYVPSVAAVTVVSYSTWTMCARSTLGVGAEAGEKDCPATVTFVDIITAIVSPTGTKVSQETMRGGAAAVGVGRVLWDELDDANKYSRGTEGKVAVGLWVGGFLWGVGAAAVLMLAVEF